MAMIRKLLPLPVGIVLVLLNVSAGSSQPWGHHGGQGMMGWGHGWGWFGAVMMVILSLAIIVGVVALIRWLWTGGPRRGAGGEQSHLDILKARYARGEINKEEFEQKKKDLGI